MNVSFNEAFMGSGEPLKGSRIPGFGAANRTPSTSRVERRSAKGVRATVTKGLSRSCVAVTRTDPRTYEVRVKGSRALLGTIRMAKGAKGQAYSYKLLRESRSHSGFPSQKAAVAKMLEKC